MSSRQNFILMAIFSLGISISGFIQVLPDWNVFWTPSNIGGLGMIIFGTLLGLLTKRPGDAVQKDFSEFKSLSGQKKTKKENPSILALIAFVIFGSVWILGCPMANHQPHSASFAQQAIDSLYVKVREVEITYDQTLILAGELHGRGTISQEQLDKVEKLGNIVKTHLDLTKSALRAYIILSDSDSKFRWEAEFASLEAVASDLVSVADSYGIKIKI